MRVLLAVCAGLLWSPIYSRSTAVRPDAFIEHVRYLASPELGGRGSGTEGLEKAAQYLEGQFKSFGVQPAGTNGYFQPFSITKSARPGQNNRLSATDARSAKFREDFIPLSFSSSGDAKGPVVFAGYGITSKTHKYDDYEGLDVKGKIVIVLRYEPAYFHRDFKQPTHHAHLVSKAINARDRGAKALILVNGFPEKKVSDDLIRFGSVSGPERSDILFLQVKNGVADGWFKSSGKTVEGLQKQIESTGKPASFALPESFEVAARVDILREKATVRNVVAFVPGRSPEYVVIGAHYDHLGLGDENSLAPSQIGSVHPGADDNASGTAGLLELARYFGSRGGPLDRGVLFIAFAAEEIGLLGSGEWVKHPTKPLNDAIAMINMDMIGRIKNSKLYIGGTGTSSAFAPIFKEIAPDYDFKVDYSQDGYSASDHTSFVAKNIPALFFFSGLHADYHKPSDTWNKIDSREGALVVNLVADVTDRLIAAKDRPDFVKVESVALHGGAAPGGGGGYGPYFGSIPDFAQEENGVKFSDVRAGSPAAKAGLKADDVLVRFGDKPIKNLYDFTFALRNSKVGDVVPVVVMRDGKELKVDVKLEARQ